MKQLDFAGNKRVLEQLGCLVDSKRFPHALIIEGEQGLGKKALARMLAAALVCRSEQKPCMECNQCRKAQSNVHPDIYEHSATGGANSFHIDVVRNMINNAYLRPNESEYKVFILGNADCMSLGAQNALLKILEEPPSYVIFIMTVSSKSAMLSTVLSRSVVVSLEGVDVKSGTNYIMEHFEGLDSNAVREALEVCNGNIGKALDAVRDGRTSEITRVCVELCEALVSGSEFDMLTACATFQKDRQGIAFALEFLKNIFRDALVYGSNADMLSGQTATITMLKNKLTRQKLVDLIGICDKLKEMALTNANNSLLITKICYSLREAVGR